MIPKLIVTDLDGTALKNDKSVSQETRLAFEHCHKKDIPIAIATARYLGGAAPFAKALHADYQILTDGTLIYENDTLIYANTMDVSCTNQIINELKKRNYTNHIAIPTTNGLYRYPYDLSDESKALPGQSSPGIPFSLEKPFPFPAAKIVAEFESNQDAECIAKLAGCSQFHYRGENRFTFFHPTASKLDAIRYLATKLHISLDEVMVFGDDINDLEMIQGCGMGVAMGNALPEIKKAAWKTTLSNEENGVAHILAAL